MAISMYLCGQCCLIRGDYMLGGKWDNEPVIFFLI